MPYSKIKSIKKLYKTRVYDLTTPNYENFLLENGILSHNSGKTYSAIDICNKWYNYHFKKDFPIENICFSLDSATERLDNKSLQRQELLILEEMGANLGASDYQTKLSKTFTYILQSFRSMNIGLVMTLPVFNMLNKSARLLCHMILTTSGINKSANTCLLTPKEIQLNQQSGKQYYKYPHIKGLGKLKKITCELIPPQIAELYEVKKSEFVYTLIHSFKDKTMSKEEKKFTYLDARIKDIYYPEITQPEVAQKMNITQQQLAAMGTWWEFKDWMDRKYKLGIYAPTHTYDNIIPKNEDDDTKG
jgi:hypothetical protein